MSSVHSPQLPCIYPEGHSNVFKGTLQVTRKLIGIGGSAQVYVGKSETGERFCLKLYKPSIKNHIDWIRCLLEAQGINIPDSGFDICLHPWHRESRAYERLDQGLENDPLRSLFPDYHGTAKIPYLACPSLWRQEQSDEGDVLVTVLEPLRKSRLPPASDVNLSDEALAAAKDVFRELKDIEYAHIYVHLREILDTLHRFKIVHGDIKKENIMNSVLFDFSLSWIYNGDLPCLEELFKRKPRQFEERRDGEVWAIRDLVLRDCKGEQALRGKFRALADCSRCRDVMDQIITGPDVATEQDSYKGRAD